MAGPVQLAVDLGTSHTVAVVRRDGQPPRALLFDGSPVLPSGVFAGRDGILHTGRDAERLALVEPERFEPHPKRRVDDGLVLLGGAELPTAVLLSAVLRRVTHEAWQAGVDARTSTVLTYPADWGQRRRAVLEEAARLAGIGVAALVDEPVAAATYCVDVLGQRVPVGGSLAVFDFGGGTLDLAVVRREPDGLRVLATGGLDDLGGLDVDAALVGHLGQLVARRDPGTWHRLANPGDTVDLRERRAFWADVRAAKEMLSRGASAPVQLPRIPEAIHLTREELDRVAGPLVDRAVDETRRLLQRSGVGRTELAGVFLVGGSSRIPLVASRLHTRLGVAPTVPEQPELPVAYGALLVAGQGAPAPAAAPSAPVVAAEEWGAVPRGPQPAAPAVAPGRRRRRLVGALGGALAAVVLAAGGAWYTLGRPGAGNDPPGVAGTPAPGSSIAVRVGAGSSPAAPNGFVACAGRYCPTTPICWSPMVVTSGIVAPQPRPACAAEHTLETFVAAPPPADIAGVGGELIERPSVDRICSAAVMAQRSLDPARTRSWERSAVIEILEGGGGRILHCLATPEGPSSRGAAFRTGA